MGDTVKALQRVTERALLRCQTQAELARRLGVTPQKWNAWKTGLIAMPVHKLQVLAALGEVDEVRLVGEYELERARKKRDRVRVLGAGLACLAIVGFADEITNTGATILGDTTYTLCALTLYGGLAALGLWKLRGDLHDLIVGDEARFTDGDGTQL